MIPALVQGSIVLEDDLFTADTRHALDFVYERLWDAEAATLSRRVVDGEVKGDGYLEDYAFLVCGVLDLYRAAGDPASFSFALDLARVTRHEFYDADAGMLYFTPKSGESFVTRLQELIDQSMPPSLGAATSLFLDLEQFAPSAGFGEVTDVVLGSSANRARGNPLEHVSFALAAEKVASGVSELTAAADEVPDEWRVMLASRYFPGLVVSRRPGTDKELNAWSDELGLDEVPSIWAGCEAANGEPTAYVCENFTCSTPTRDLDEALAWFTVGEGA